MTTSPRPYRRPLAAALGTVLGISALTACATASAGGTGGADTVSIAGFSVMQQANTKVISDFKHTAAGKGVEFAQSYGASGDQARAVIAGLHTDEAHLSLEPDMAKLVQAKLVSPDWQHARYDGVLTQSVVVMVVRKGDPKHITGWDDLVKPGVTIVTPNPGSSGSAKWNILAAYGSQIAQGRSPAQATAYLRKLIANTVALPGSGHDATTAFESGTGDVLLSYENEAIEARRAGADFDYVVPAQTLLIQNPAALTTDANPAAKAFLAFQRSRQGQTDYAEQGFRPLDPKIHVPVQGANDPGHPYPTPTSLLTIDHDFGGWPAADQKFFAEGSGIVTKLLAQAGKS